MNHRSPDRSGKRGVGHSTRVVVRRVRSENGNDKVREDTGERGRWTGLGWVSRSRSGSNQDDGKDVEESVQRRIRRGDRELVNTKNET